MTLSLAEVLRDHWPDHVRRHAARLAVAHYRAARAVLACRTPALGGHAWRCGCCRGPIHYVYHSCNHRSCPQCGALDQQRWAAVQEARLLPGVPYFLVTLTVPDALRGICKLHPAILYDLLLREAAAAMKDLCRGKLGGEPGFTAVLHTWGRQMQHHPHVHLVIPAVVLDPLGNGLRFPADPTFLVHGRPLAARFRNRLELALKQHHPELHALIVRDHPRLFREPWVADVRHTGSGRPALRYLARYVFRTALGPGRLLGYDQHGRIRLLCHESGSNRPHVIALPADTFLTRWLTHVLPKGFVRVRHYGWLSGAARATRLRVRALVCGELDEPAPALPAPPVPRCPHCGAELKLLVRLEPRGPPRAPPPP
jgi:hypothetical protein